MTGFYPEYLVPVTPHVIVRTQSPTHSIYFIKVCKNIYKSNNDYRNRINNDGTKTLNYIIDSILMINK